MKKLLVLTLALFLLALNPILAQGPPFPGGPKGNFQPPKGPFGPKGPEAGNPFPDFDPGLPPQMAAALQKAFAARVPGPQKMPLSDVAEISLTNEMAFIPAGPAQELMGALGNQVKGEILGIVTEGVVGLEGLTILELIREGHVEDSEAGKFNANSILEQIRKGTEEGNAHRAKMGISPLHLVGWDEQPSYNQERKMLSWSILAREENVPTLNFTQILLGRDTMLKVLTVGEQAAAIKAKGFSKQVVAKTNFIPGKRYEDFQPGVDKVAEYGLTALIAGFAAKKLGLIAAFLAFLVKGWKIIAVVVVAVGAGISKLFFGKKNTEEDGTGLKEI